MGACFYLHITSMTDLIYLTLIVGFFVLAAGYAQVCDPL